MKLLLNAIVLLIVGASNMGYAVTIDEAYAAIPHKRTVFNFAQSHLPADQAKALVGLFELVEQALVIKVDGCKAFEANSPAAVQKTIFEYDKLLVSLNNYQTPASLQIVKDNIFSAVQKHQDYFKAKQKLHDKAHPYELSFTSEVYEASNNLRQAYQMLMLNKSESENNKMAFYDYLCALDFI